MTHTYFFLVYKLSFCIVYINCHQCTYSWQRMNCIYFAVLLPQLHFLLMLWKNKLNSFCFEWFFYVVPVSSYTAWIRLVLKQSLHYGKVTVDCFQESTYFFIDVFNLKSKLASNDENRSKIQTAQFCIKHVFIQTVNLKKQTKRNHSNKWNRTMIRKTL